MAIRAVGFDFGETLATYRDAPLNWASLYRPALLRVAAELGLGPTETELGAAEAALRRYNTRLNPRSHEVPAEEVFSAALASWGVDDPVRLQAAVEAFFGFFRQSLVAYPDTRTTLAELRRRGLRVGVLTDVPYGMPRRFVDNDVQETEIQPLIDALLTSVEVGWRKPSPEGFRGLARALEVAPEEMIYVGNEPKDIHGANAASMTSVLVDRNRPHPDLGRRSPPEPRAVITRTSELLLLPELTIGGRFPSEIPVGITREQV